MIERYIKNVFKNVSFEKLKDYHLIVREGNSNQLEADYLDNIAYILNDNVQYILDNSSITDIKEIKRRISLTIGDLLMEKEVDSNNTFNTITD